jgi:hypothetical protein
VVVLCAVGEVAADDGLASGCGVGVVEAELVGVVVGVDDLPAFGDFVVVFVGIFVAVWVGFSHVLSAAGRVGAGVLLGLEATKASDVAVVVAPGALLSLGLTLGLGLAGAVELAGGAVGLTGELGGGVAGVDVAGDETGALDREVGEAPVDDGDRQGTIGVDWLAAGVVTDPAPPVRALPPPAAELAALVAFWPSRAADTDEVSASRSGAKLARTAPATKTAQASAIAGLISASRQSVARRALWPGVLP